MKKSAIKKNEIKTLLLFLLLVVAMVFSTNTLNAQTSDYFDRITVQAPASGQVSEFVSVDATFAPYTSPCVGNCEFGWFSAILSNADSSTSYIGSRTVGQSYNTSLKFSFDTNDFHNGNYVLDLIAYNPEGGIISTIRSIPLTINNPPITIAFKFPAANSVITTPSFLMDVEVTKNGQPYEPTFVSYEMKQASQPDTEYINLGVTYPAFNGGDSRGYWACHLVPVQLHPGNYIIRATLSKGQSATLPLTISISSCPTGNVVQDHTPPVFTVLSPHDGDDSFAQSISLSATAYDPGASFGSVSSGLRDITFFIQGSNGDFHYGTIVLFPDASGMVTGTWIVADGLTRFRNNVGQEKVYPQPPFTIGVIATDKAGNTGDWVYIHMGSTDSNISLSKVLTATIVEPSVNQPLPAGTIQTRLSVATSEAATCKYSDLDQEYSLMPNTMTGTEISHTATLTGLQNSTSYTKYVRCIGTSGSVMTSSQRVAFSVDNPNNPSPTCDLTSASWSAMQATEGQTVSLNVQGTDCIGKSVSFEVFEKDILSSDDIVRANPSNVVFNGDSASGSWTIELQGDGFAGGNPEYYFTASVVGTNEKISSGTGTSELLSVAQTPSYVCGDRICSGIETNLSCPADCLSTSRPTPFYLERNDTNTQSNIAGNGSGFNSQPTSPSGPIFSTTTPSINQVPGPISVGDGIQLKRNTHVRTSPGIFSVALTTQLTGAKGKVVEGPVQLDGYTWWRVDYEAGEDGWSVDILMAKISESGLS